VEYFVKGVVNNDWSFRSAIGDAELIGLMGRFTSKLNLIFCNLLSIKPPVVNHILLRFTVAFAI
jgi:hypothetical protein